MTIRDAAVVACSKSSFAGSATINTRFLRVLRNIGIECHLVAHNTPPEAALSPDASPYIHVPPALKAASEQKPSETLASEALTETLINVSTTIETKGMIPILWGTNLFPYGRACLNAALELQRLGIKHALIEFPVGADIWEIGMQIPACVSSILLHPATNVLATYSLQFAQEIRSAFHVDRPFTILAPYVDRRRFHRLDSLAKARLRQALGFSQDDTLFVCHSNMRPVKRIDLTVHLFDLLASVRPRNSFLLLLGPSPSDCPSRDPRVRYVGYQKNVVPYLQVADFYLNTSIHDSFNTAMLEAMSCGAIPITTSAPALAEYVRSSASGYVFPLAPNLAQISSLARQCGEIVELPSSELREFVARVLNEPIYQRELKENASLLLSTRFTYDICRKNLQILMVQALSHV